MTAAAPAEEAAPRDWLEANLQIKHRERGVYVPFRANKCQLRLRAAMQKQMVERGFVRLICLKARQVGISTEAQAQMFRTTLLLPNVEALVVSHELQSATAIFRRTKIFEARCPHRKKKKYSSRREIEFDEPHLSAIRVAVAGSDDVGRSDTRHFLHLSELAFWRDAYAGDALDGLLNSVQDAPGTVILIESTANGCTGEFYDAWNAAENHESNFEPFFVSWLDDDGYCLPGRSPDDPYFKNVPPEWRKDEPALRELGATDAQLAWRLERIGSKCRGSLDKWNQEYPTTPRDAFISSGRPVFEKSLIEPMRLSTENAEKASPAPRFTIRRHDDGKWDICDDSYGLLRIWERPDRHAQYLGTADVARGITVDSVDGEGQKLGDYSTVGIVNRTTNREVAVWHGRRDPTEFGAICDALGRYYNDALMVVEANGLYGIPAIRELLSLEYPNVYRKQRIDLPTAHHVDQSDHGSYMSYGFWSSREAKIIAVTDLKELLRKKRFFTPEPEAWIEMLTFETKRDGTMGARSRCYDDRVIRCAIAASILIANPLATEATRQGPVENSIAWFEALTAQRARGNRPPSLQL